MRTPVQRVGPVGGRAVPGRIKAGRDRGIDLQRQRLVVRIARGIGAADRELIIAGRGRRAAERAVGTERHARGGLPTDHAAGHGAG